jgi:hypothetical protein
MPKSRERLLRPSAISHAPTKLDDPGLALPLPRCRRTFAKPLEAGLTARPPRRHNCVRVLSAVGLSPGANSPTIGAGLFWVTRSGPQRTGARGTRGVRQA